MVSNITAKQELPPSDAMHEMLVLLNLVYPTDPKRQKIADKIRTFFLKEKAVEEKLSLDIRITTLLGNLLKQTKEEKDKTEITERIKKWFDLFLLAEEEQKKQRLVELERTRIMLEKIGREKEASEILRTLLKYFLNEIEKLNIHEYHAVKFNIEGKEYNLTVDLGKVLKITGDTLSDSLEKSKPIKKYEQVFRDTVDVILIDKILADPENRLSRKELEANIALQTRDAHSAISNHKNSLWNSACKYELISQFNSMFDKTTQQANQTRTSENIIKEEISLTDHKREKNIEDKIVNAQAQTLDNAITESHLNKELEDTTPNITIENDSPRSSYLDDDDDDYKPRAEAVTTPHPGLFDREETKKLAEAIHNKPGGNKPYGNNDDENNEENEIRRSPKP